MNQETYKSYNLPKDLINHEPRSVNIKFYEASSSSDKNKVILNQHMLCIITKGEKEIIEASDKESFDNSSVLLLSAGSKLMSENTLNNGVYSSTLLFFSSKVLEDLCTDNRIDYDSINSDDKNKITHLEKDDFLLNYQESLNLLKKSLSKDPLLLEVKVNVILQYLIKSYPEEFKKFAFRALNDPEHVKFKSFFNYHIDNFLTVEELSFLANMSLSTFKRRFKEVYNMSPGKYITNYRMEKALKYLENGLSITNTAYKVGYENIASFSNEFKKHFGESPSSYSVKNHID